MAWKKNWKNFTETFLSCQETSFFFSAWENVPKHRHNLTIFHVVFWLGISETFLVSEEGGVDERPSPPALEEIRWRKYLVETRENPCITSCPFNIPSCSIKRPHTKQQSTWLRSESLLDHTSQFSSYYSQRPSFDVRRVKSSHSHKEIRELQ